MRDLLVGSWEDFQEIGRYWMQHLVQQQMRIAMKYHVYGGNGQGQGGVDLVPVDPQFGIVGQSKCWNGRSLTWAEIEKELVKTDNYPGPIQRYVILTTATRHTSVQDKTQDDRCTITRSRPPFQLLILYWGELEDLSFIPDEVRLRMFPALAAQARAGAARQPGLNAYADSLLHARRVLPLVLPQEHRDWLASWDFRLGYVPEGVFELFHRVSIDMDRVLSAAATPGLESFLHEGNRVELHQCLPAARNVFLRTFEFARAVVNETAPRNTPSGPVLAHCHDDASANQRIAAMWRRSADALLQAYREVIEGQPQG